MRKWKAWLFALAVLIGIGTIGTVSVKAEAQNLNQGKRVLFISSYSYGWDTVQTQIEGCLLYTSSWTFEEVDAKLKNIMVNIFHNLDDAAKKYGMEGNYVAGANIAGFLKVADAMTAQGIV